MLIVNVTIGQSMKTKYTEIQVLRAIAIIYVLIEHGIRVFFRDSHTQQFLTERLFAFWGGVDIFFAIAGYLLYRSVISLKHKNLVASDIIIVFWLKRAWRLWPIAWGLALFSFIVVTLFVYSSQNTYYFLSVASSWIIIILNIQNLMVYQFHNGMGFDSHYYEVYWSLSLEEQLYMIFALVIILFKPRAGVIVCSFVIFLQLFFHRSALGSDLAWYIRSDSFCWGVLLGYFAENKDRFNKFEPVFLKNKKIAIPFFIFILLVIASPQLMYACNFYVSVMALASGTLVYLASYDAGYIPFSGVIKQLLIKVGDFSYSLYLVHMPIMLVIYHYMPEGSRHGARGAIAFALFVVISILVSWVIYNRFECKFKERGRVHADNFLKKRHS